MVYTTAVGRMMVLDSDNPCTCAAFELEMDRNYNPPTSGPER